MSVCSQEEARDSLEKMLLQNPIYLILSPPRSASTALARALLNHSAIGPYIHEPCDLFLHHQAGWESVTESLQQNGLGAGTLIKEMTFQLGTEELCDLFLRHSRSPIVFLVRHPRRALESRLRMVLKDLAAHDPSLKGRTKAAIKRKDYSSVGDLVNEQRFPLEFTGWFDLRGQIERCREMGIEYRVIFAKDFRSDPEACLEPLLDQWGLSFESSMVDWRGSQDFQVKGLADQSDWYRKVEKSQGVLPEAEDILPKEHFPVRFQAHLQFAEGVYGQLLDDPWRLGGH